MLMKGNWTLDSSGAHSGIMEISSRGFALFTNPILAELAYAKRLLLGFFFITQIQSSPTLIFSAHTIAFRLIIYM